MKKKMMALALLVAQPLAAQVKETNRLDACREVLQEVLDMPEGIPRDLLAKAECVIVIPSAKKFALGFGGRFGKGAAVCRTGGRGPWGPPLMVSIGGGNFGLQIGGEAVDLVFLVMNRKGMEHLLQSQFTLGADASVAAGPKGRNAEAATDIQMYAEILTYSRSRGLFAGIAIDGAVIKQDKDGNERVYGDAVSPKALLFTPGQAIPPAGKALVDALRGISPEKTGP
ncbi:MAG TPA: lipid-binding SYLF domain-containing protein [Vicinamibacteria bacterium]|jgi:lipid-binding SYLF domain-containing protein|nr:lipid-binding SYLF domain-containing protein [Vicinamibacteria bacterium]